MRPPYGSSLRPSSKKLPSPVSPLALSRVGVDADGHVEPRVHAIEHEHDPHVDQQPVVWPRGRDVVHHRAQQHHAMGEDKVQNRLADLMREACPKLRIGVLVRAGETDEQHRSRGGGEVHGQEGQLPSAGPAAAVLLVHGNHSSLGGLHHAGAQVKLGHEAQPVLLALPEPQAEEGSEHEEEGAHQVGEVHPPLLCLAFGVAETSNPRHQEADAAQEVAHGEPPRPREQPHLPNLVRVALHAASDHEAEGTQGPRQPHEDVRRPWGYGQVACHRVDVEEERPRSVGAVARHRPLADLLPAAPPERQAPAHAFPGLVLRVDRLKHSEVGPDREADAPREVRRLDQGLLEVRTVPHEIGHGEGCSCGKENRALQVHDRDPVGQRSRKLPRIPCGVPEDPLAGGRHR
mmetsp:Transcript_699/g.1848  ORF Transcript_699/g.1848 Transcript_699/m.1848 type:complete len:404 (+) Transcript_699:227-1438(+)